MAADKGEIVAERKQFLLDRTDQRRVVAFYNQPGTAEQHIKEGKNTIAICTNATD